MSDEDKTFSGSFVLDLRIWWRQAHTLYCQKNERRVDRSKTSLWKRSYDPQYCEGPQKCFRVSEILHRTLRNNDGASLLWLHSFGSSKTSEYTRRFPTLCGRRIDFTSFSDVLVLCTRDIVTGLEYLHKNDIAHRDLKPGNTLVCNQHYSRQNDVAKSYAECPIVCKLADFGLSRSPELQTSTFLKAKTESTCRGTPVYMTPEILLENLKFAGQEDLKKADIWSLVIMMFSMINPNLSNSYRAEFEASGVPFSERLW